jgi:thiamine pyrophosphate-dependent acetolactate synthase large subunit-like protein
VTLNPGATTRGLHESLVTYGGNALPEVITCSHEEVAVAMAEGYYDATGKPQATLVHNIVGLQHASKAIYEAWLNSVPMIVIGGTGPLDSTHARGAYRPNRTLNPARMPKSGPGVPRATWAAMSRTTRGRTRNWTPVSKPTTSRDPRSDGEA